MKVFTKLSYVLMGILIIASLSHTVKTFVVCDGTTVRGLFKMECISETAKE